MRKILVALVLVAVGVGVPVGVLVVRALESAAIEEEGRHRSIADRAFDEMEGALSRFLAEEELRPFGDYRFYQEISAASPDARRRSPLSRAPVRPFVKGYFQIDPDGGLRTPRRPRDVALAESLGDFAPSPELDRIEAELEAAWTAAQRRAPRELAGSADATTARSDGQVARAPALQRAMRGLAPAADGRSRADLAEEDVADAAPAPEKDAQREPSAGGARSDDPYDVLRSFNLAEERRAQRKQEIRVEPAPALPKKRVASAPSTEAKRSGERVASFADEEAAAVGRARAAAAEAPTAAAPASPSTGADAARGAETDRASATVRVALDPMVGRAADDDTLVLYRTVVAGEQGYRQGLVLDWRGLGEWLEAEVIAQTALGGAATVAFFGPDGAAGDAGAGAQYVYRHRFAEPFDAFGVELGLPALPGGRGTGTIHALALLFAVVAAGGLFAVYRMVSVVVEFAERRNRFVAAVTHELKTPLTAIRMYGEMLRDGMVRDDAKRSEYYGTITDESERLSRLIDNVLDFSRLEKGERDVHVREEALWPVVREAVEKLRPHAESHGFALVPSTDAEAARARFDPDVVTQVVFNLVDNARKYAAGAERREIQIACAEEPDAVVLSVRDFGPGVPPHDLARIFEPFFRREDELTRTTKGTGIGLALVKNLVLAMAGRISARNADGGGLRIDVRLPRVDASTADRQ